MSSFTSHQIASPFIGLSMLTSSCSSYRLILEFAYIIPRDVVPFLSCDLPPDPHTGLIVPGFQDGHFTVSIKKSPPLAACQLFPVHISKNRSTEQNGNNKYGIQSMHACLLLIFIEFLVLITSLCVVCISYSEQMVKGKQGCTCNGGRGLDLSRSFDECQKLVYLPQTHKTF